MRKDIAIMATTIPLDHRWTTNPFDGCVTTENWIESVVIQQSGLITFLASAVVGEVAAKLEAPQY